ncbi:hypothetical protein QJQ45_020069 [Haematococcus lacustris]|nr:hypothetical protein QJQ45_020069 [Haematococcus lacustris]
MQCHRSTVRIQPQRAPLSSRPVASLQARAAANQTAVQAAACREEEEYTLTLRKPVGIAFAQKAVGEPGELSALVHHAVLVDEVIPGGIADKTGRVRVGDILTRCSAVVLKAGTEGQFEREGYGQRPYDNFSKVMFDCRGQDFKSVMAALKSNNSRWGIMDVTLVFTRNGGAAEQPGEEPQGGK